MLVSIIIPTFNRGDKVIEAIKSAQQQTYPYKQIIVIDDGSEDETRKLVENLEGVEYYYQQNQRQGAARNKGLGLVRGEYIATLDSDDVWNEDFLTESVECLEKHNLDFVFSNWLTKKDNELFPSAWEVSETWKNYTENPAEEWFLLDSEKLRDLFIHTCPAPSSSLLIRRKSISSGWNPEMKIADDWCFVLDMLMDKPRRAAFTLNRLWTKNVHTNNIYDGINRQTIAADLEIHDTKLMKKRYFTQLTFREKRVFNLRLIKGHLILRYSSWLPGFKKRWR